jgi:ferredoxin-NADP reductase/predicted pyridoxine 5'-phosphate oxidase superfamily flavin-nucleotide-binding protein/ferredoxin
MSNEAVTAPPGWSRAESPWHKGELAVQDRVGVTDRMATQGRRSIRDYLPEQHREFFEKIPYLFTGLLDCTGQPWASILVGRPGFIRSPDPYALHIQAHYVSGDPAAAALRDGVDIGLLGIELPTRRRNRLNGVVRGVIREGFQIDVAQSFGNCPQYIQAREVEFISDPARAAKGTVVETTVLDAHAREVIGNADTFFIATSHQDEEAKIARGVDVSHRGGKPGFVRVDDEQTLTAPDFIGNFFFNTIGNLVLDPRAGLLFIDFERGSLLYLACTAEVLWDGPEIKSFAGAERLLRFTVSRVVRIESALPVRWNSPEFSPFLERTGSWEDSARILEAEAARETWQPFRIVAVRDESFRVRSFVLRPEDGRTIWAYEPGQYLPIRLPKECGAGRQIRTYTLSDTFNARDYTLTVKREGFASSWLHERATVGMIIEAKAPRGDFTFRPNSGRPVVFVSAGIGITPVMAMVRGLLVNGTRSRHAGRIHFFHGARDGQSFSFSQELRELATRYSNFHLHVSFSQPADEDTFGIAYDYRGRLDADTVKSVLLMDDYDFYLCGPVSFMQSMYNGLRAIRVADERIYFESFGSGRMIRSKEGVGGGERVADGEVVPVTFEPFGRRALWHRHDGSLLELAEACDLAPPHGCRMGTCGACAAQLVTGAVDYVINPLTEIAEGEVLICCATPRLGARSNSETDRVAVTLRIKA